MVRIRRVALLVGGPILQLLAKAKLLIAGILDSFSNQVTLVKRELLSPSCI
jgi:hypothetical protein